MAAMMPEALQELMDNLTVLVQALAVNAQATAVSTPSGGGGHGKRTLSMKNFTKIGKFSKGESEWKDFWFGFVVALGSESPGMLDVLKGVETMNEETIMPKVRELDPDVADRLDIEKVSKELIDILVILTEGEAKMMIQIVAAQDGILASHRLYHHYNRRSLPRECCGCIARPCTRCL